MIQRYFPVLPRHLRTGYLRNRLRARAMLHLLFPALASDRRVPRLPACDRRRMAGPPPHVRTTPAPTEHDIAEAYHAHPYPHGRWEDRA